ncbi:MAG: UDP-forming cellulose synthase catalytic subunit [Myxococcales bacterium]|nr:UDP-forming cellulose synthase catalytic subunit [Myxococcales bacterium]
MGQSQPKATPPPPPPSQEGEHVVVDWQHRLADSGAVPLVALLLALLPLGSYALVHLPLGAHLGLSVGLMGVGLLLLRRFPKLRIAAMLLSVAASGRYLYWRGTETLYLELTADGLLSIALFGAELYGFLILVGGYFQTAIVTDRRPVPLTGHPDQLPSVDIFIPTYNEPIDVLRRTVVGAVAIDYPHKQVYILDDTPRAHKNAKKAAELAARRDAVAALAEEVGCHSVRRPNNKGAKAGNINHALQRTTGDLVAIFDADHVPVRSFLQSTVGFFVADDDVALVQTPHHFYNPDPFERNLFREGRMPPEQHLFYHRIQKGNDFWNSAFFCGSCAVLRRKALLGVGGIAQETVTEDAHTALKLHGEGWESRYLDIPQAAGLATEKFGFHVQQRIRWARGMAQILRLDNPLTRKGLTLAQRFNYFNAAAHFLFGLPRLVYLLAPSAFLLFGLHPLNADVRQVLIYALPHLFLVGACTASVNRNARYSFWPEVYETSIAWYTSWVTTVAMVMPRFGTFNVTPKGGEVTRAEFDWRSARPMLVLYALTLASLFVTPWRIASAPSHWDTIVVAAVWNIYNLMVLSSALTVAVERPQRRGFDRIPVDVAARVVELPGVAPTTTDGTFVQPPPPPTLPTGLAAGATPCPAPPAPEPRGARVVDLSERGARLMLDTSTPLSERVRLMFETPTGEPVTVDARVVSQREEGEEERRVAGLAFDDVSPDTRIRIIETMFTDPTRWTHERFVEDDPLRSAVDVLVTPLRVAFNHLTGRNPEVDHRGDHLTAFAESRTCSTCGGKQLAVLHTCSQCGSEMPTLQEVESAASVPAPLWQRMGELSRGFFAMPLLALAIVLAVGWKPVVDPLYGQLEKVSEDRVTPTRVGELASAHRQLRSLHRQLNWAMLPLAPALPRDWSKRLWSARYAGELERRDDPEFHEVVVLLDEAVMALQEAGEAYRRQADLSLVPPLATKAEERLDQASRMLAAAIRNPGDL